MDVEAQAALLRFLQNGTYRPVGAERERRSDVRVIAATNRDLEAEIKRGDFREDLYYRINVVRVPVPPLRERAGDIPILIDHLIGEMNSAHGREVSGITPEARTLLVRYSWPGNVRELRNCIENMVVLSRGVVLEEADVPHQIAEAGRESRPVSGGYALQGRSLDEVERDLIAANLELCEGNREKTARLLGIGERTLYRKIKEYGL